MFEMKQLFRMFKPIDNENQITAFDFMIGGTNFAPNFVRGVIICTILNSEICTSQTKKYEGLDSDKDMLKIVDSSLIQHNFQLDFYKRNAENATEIETYSEALRVREWLKSYQVQDYLSKFNAEILPNYAIIQNTSELIENKQINRSFFEFSVISKIEIAEFDKYVDKIKIDKTLILRS